MQGFKKYYKLRVIGHLIFWLISVAFFLFLFYLIDRESFVIDRNTIIKAIIPVFCFAIAVYINLYILIPKFLKPKNYIFYAFWLILTMAVSSVLIQLFFMYPFNYLFSPENEFQTFNTDLYSDYFFATAIYVGITSFLKFAKEWFVLQDLNLKYEQIERKKLEAELKTLKGQVHPHFLFNSLNNIYSLSLTHPQKVPELILKLSDLMRHVIYESRENFISLSKELVFVENYLALQKIRISDNIKISYLVKGGIPEKRIAPLLFEPFIDNAFKHGLNSKNGNDYVSVLFDFRNPESLQFTIENSYEEGFTEHTKYKGIGLENVKQRLKHLYNEDEYSLSINRNDRIFKINLRLDLKD